MRFGLAERVTALVVAVILLLGLFLGVYFTNYESRRLTRSLEDRVQVLLDNLSANLQYPVLVSDEEGIERLVNGVLSQADITQCRILDRDGTPIFERGYEPEGDSRTFTAAISVERALESTDEDLILGGGPSSAVEVIASVELRVAMAHLDEEIANVSGTFVILIIVAVLAASFVSYVLLGLFLGRPMAMLADATRRIARGELEVAVAIDSNDEIGELATAFNAMTAELQNTMVSREYVDSILDSMIDALLVLSPQGMITRVNVAASELVGYGVDELLGESIDRLFAAGRPSSGDTVFDPSSVTGAHMQNTETLFRTRDGLDVPVMLSTSPMTDSLNNVQAVVCVALDIRAQKLAQEEIRKLSTAVEQSTGGIALADLEGNLSYVNNAFARMHGYEARDLLGKPMDILHPEEHKEAHQKALQTVVDQGAWAGELDALTAEGTVFPTYLSVSTLRDDIGFPIAIVAHVNDMTSQKELELQLVQAQKLDSIGQLAGGVAHDFNNMLGAISGYAEMIRQRFGKENEGIAKYAGRILEAAKRSADLTTKLLAFARKGTFETVQVDLHATIRDVISLLEHTIDRRIAIVQKLDAPMATIMGDRTQLQNTVLNLAVNARDAMPEGGTMTLSTALVRAASVPWQGPRPASSAETYVKIAVTDTGIGMDEATKSRIFEPFFTTKQLGKGTGLGLASVYGTVQSHNGVISLQSEVDQGSCFELYFPLVISEQIREAPTSDEITTGSGTILVVDDERLVRDMAEDMLSDIGYRVETCNDGAEAVEFYREHHERIDLVILDMVMPRLGGYEALLQMQAIDDGVRVIISSGYSANDETRKALESGAVCFVQKPFDLNGLAKAIRDVLAPVK